MSKRGFVLSKGGILQEYGDAGQLWNFGNNAFDTIGAPLPRGAVVTFDVVPNVARVFEVRNVTATGDTEHNVPRFPQINDPVAPGETA